MNKPIKDIMVSSKQAILMRKGVWNMPYISKNKGVIQVNVGKPVDYYHVELPNYFTDNIICENLVTESCGYNQVKQGSVVYFGNKTLGGFTRASENSAKSNLSTLIKKTINPINIMHNNLNIN